MLALQRPASAPANANGRSLGHVRGLSSRNLLNLVSPALIYPNQRDFASHIARHPRKSRIFLSLKFYASLKPMRASLRLSIEAKQVVQDLFYKIVSGYSPMLARGTLKDDCEMFLVLEVSRKSFLQGKSEYEQVDK